MSNLPAKKNAGSGKKNLEQRFEQIKKEHPEAEVEIWAMDEHRCGLQRTTQRTWSKVGRRSIELIRPGYKWCYVWSWVRPATGELEVWLSEHVNTDLHNAMLERLANSLQVGERRKVLLVLDRAGWHTSKQLKVPPGIELFFLPAATPELQPAERLWTLFDEPLIGLAASEIEQIETALIERSRWLFENPDVVSGRAFFHWWPEQRHIGLN